MPQSVTTKNKENTHNKNKKTKNEINRKKSQRAMLLRVEPERRVNSSPHTQK